MSPLKYRPGIDFDGLAGLPSGNKSERSGSRSRNDKNYYSKRSILKASKSNRKIDSSSPVRKSQAIGINDKHKLSFKDPTKVSFADLNRSRASQNNSRQQALLSED